MDKITIQQEDGQPQVLLSKLPKNRENPFLTDAIEEIKKNVVRKYVNSSGKDRKAVLSMVDKDTGEVLHTTFVRQIYVDEEQFTKLFIRQFPELWDLSKSSIRVLGYVMTAMRMGQDMIVFDMEACMEYTKYKSKKTIYKAIAELCVAGIIARSWNDTLFYINPTILFQGSRVTFMTDYIKKNAIAEKAIEEAKKAEESKLLKSELENFENNEK